MKSAPQFIPVHNQQDELYRFLRDENCVTVMDFYGRVIFANEKYCSLLDKSQSEVVGEFHTTVKSELHSNSYYKDLWQTIKGGNIWQGILTDVSSTGDEIQFDSTIIPIKKLRGRLGFYVCLFTPCEQRAYKHLKVVPSSEYDNPFSKRSTYVVFEVDERARILSVNRKIGSLSPSDIAGGSLYSFINSASRENIQSIIKLAFLDAQPNKLRTIERDKNGEIITYLSHIIPMKDETGRVKRAIVASCKEPVELGKSIVEDREEQKYKTIFQTMNVAIMVVADQYGKITDWNKGAEFAFGYKAKEIIGKDLSVLIATGMVKRSLKYLNNAVSKIDNINPDSTIKMRALRKNGTEFPVEFALSKWDRDGSTFFCAMMLDISKRVQLAEKLKKKSRELELFLYRSAHDLKAPFTSASGLVELLRECELDQSGREIVELLDRTLKQGSSMLSNLEGASFIPDKKRTIEPIPLASLLDDIINSLSGLDNFNSIEFKLSVDPELRINSNKVMITSMFQNIIQNAIKFSLPACAKHDPWIEIKIKSEEDGIKINIEDNGCGILKSEQTKIFELYYRGKNQDCPGSGLGLYIVGKVIEDLGGRISVRSRPKKGTTFKIYIPNSN